MILNISTWWEAMDTLQKIYWCIAVPFSVMFLIQLILTFVGGDMDGVEAGGDADVSVDGDTGIDFQFLSIKNLIAFFTIFGWVGIVCLNSGLGPVISSVIATGSGLVMMLIMATIMYYMSKLSESGTLNLNNAKGKVGTVYLTIPEKRSGMGQVQIKVQGFQTLDAMTDGEALSTGSIVEVLEIINNEILLVKASSK
ncbi:MAG: hypothetical protein JW798_09045 [Prolixibacteraceae bacterium]|nr:hypothetical protein [Prolixibacteraceae bacterium]